MQATQFLPTLAFALVFLSGGAVSAAGLSTHREGRDAAGSRVGVFDAPSVFLAYCRSSNPLYQADLKQYEARRRTAAREGDRLGALELDLQFADCRTVASADTLNNRVLVAVRSGWKRSIDQILHSLQPQLASVARAAQVDAIATTPLFLSDEAESVDITELLVQQLLPDSTTRQMISALRSLPNDGRK